MGEKKTSRYVEMTAPELVNALCHNAFPGSQVHEEIKGALSTVLTKNLVDSIEKHERAASKLSNRLLWLNIILGAFTIIGAILAVISYLK